MLTRDWVERCLSSQVAYTRTEVAYVAHVFNIRWVWKKIMVCLDNSLLKRPNSDFAWNFGQLMIYFQTWILKKIFG
jgi:hypothetical protein